MPFRRWRGLGGKPTRRCVECVVNPKTGTLGYKLGCQVTVGGETLMHCAICSGLKPGVDEFSPDFREKSGGEFGAIPVQGVLGGCGRRQRMLMC